MRKSQGLSAGSDTVVTLMGGHWLFRRARHSYQGLSHSIGTLYGANRGLAWAKGFSGSFLRPGAGLACRVGSYSCRRLRLPT